MTILEMIEAAIASVKEENIAIDSSVADETSADDAADFADIIPASVRYSVHAPC